MTIELLDTEEAQAEDPVEVQVSLLLLCALSCAVLSPAVLTLPAYAHITYHSSTALVTSPTVLIATKHAHVSSKAVS